VATLLGAGCSSTEPSNGVFRCPRTTETDNFGCAVVTGTVRDAVGVPLAGATVTLVAPTGESQAYDNPFETTGPDGAYRVEIHRFEAPTPVPAADTVPLYLRATVAIAPPASDSILVRTIFVPVDSVPKVVEADLFFQAGP
jgi:hypothetical protein